MWRAEDSVGIVEAIRAYVYRTGLTKESRKYWERVAHVHTATAKDSHGIQECTMSPRTRDAKQQAKARKRHYLKAQERLARDRRQAQHAATVVEQALHDLGLPNDLVVEIEGRLRSQHKLLGKIFGIMFPPLFGCRTNAELCVCRASGM